MPARRQRADEFVGGPDTRFAEVVVEYLLFSSSRIGRADGAVVDDRCGVNDTEGDFPPGGEGRPVDVESPTHLSIGGERQYALPRVW